MEVKQETLEGEAEGNGLEQSDAEESGGVNSAFQRSNSSLGNLEASSGVSQNYIK